MKSHSNQRRKMWLGFVLSHFKCQPEWNPGPKIMAPFSKDPGFAISSVGFTRFFSFLMLRYALLPLAASRRGPPYRSRARTFTFPPFLRGCFKRFGRFGPTDKRQEHLRTKGFLNQQGHFFVFLWKTHSNTCMMICIVFLVHTDKQTKELFVKSLRQSSAWSGYWTQNSIAPKNDRTVSLIPASSFKILCRPLPAMPHHESQRPPTAPPPLLAAVRKARRFQPSDLGFERQKSCKYWK